MADEAYRLPYPLPAFAFIIHPASRALHADPRYHILNLLINKGKTYMLQAFRNRWCAATAHAASGKDLPFISTLLSPP